MSFFDALVESFANVTLPRIICPIISRSAGPNCKNLTLAIYLNDSLLDAYKKGATSVGLWDYDTVRRTAKRFPQVRAMVDRDKVLKWLEKEGHQDIIRALEETPGGLLWLERQIESFKHDLFD